MKKFLLFIFIFVGTYYAQEISVVGVEPITTLEQDQFFYPVVSDDNSKILFTSVGYQGLWMFNNNSKEIVKINNYSNAGYEPKFLDGNKIIFRKDSFENNRRFISIREFDVINKSEIVLTDELRNIAQVKVVNGKEINYSENKELLKVQTENGLSKIASNEIPLVMIENSDLVLYKNNVRTLLNPLGEGNYLWASVSDDGEKLLFTFAGEGSFVTNLSGKILNELGYAHYPQWSKDGKWILYMKDYDDGEKVTESDLFVYSVDAEREYKITDTKNVHEMYAVWSKLNNNNIYCNSTDGIIYKIELKFN